MSYRRFRRARRCGHAGTVAQAAGPASPDQLAGLAHLAGRAHGRGARDALALAASSWSAEAREAWRSWWSSPMASVWVESDAVVLRRALRLVDDLAVGRSADHAALTALEDRLGLTPKARRRLSWEIERSSAVESAPVVSLAGARDPRLR